MIDWEDAGMALVIVLGVVFVVAVLLTGVGVTP